MAATSQSIVDGAALYVAQLFDDYLDARYSYHNLAHTKDVVEGVREIGKAAGLDEAELEPVLLAAWFHDTGVTSVYVSHEQRSADIAMEYLRSQSLDEGAIETVRSNILATDLRVGPSTLQEKVICDADLLHIGKKGFWEQSQALRSEWEKFLHEQYSDEEWCQKQLTFMMGRVFHTDYARKTYQEGLEHNLKKLQKKLRRLNAPDNPVDENPKKKDKDEKAEKALKPVDGILGKGDRGVETMFRLTSRNHVEFSSMVDGKANILITINTLVISVVISVLFRKLDTNTYMTIPTFVFIGVCLMTIVFAVLASRPKVTSGVFMREDIISKRANLLFFGNFYRMPVAEFEWGMREMLKDKDYLYDSMIRDFYYLGQVLGKKYQYLRIAYNIFMYGFVFSILFYVVMFFAFMEAPIDLLPLTF